MDECSEADLLAILQLTLGVAMNCDQRGEVITRITQDLDESTMQELQLILEQVIAEHLPAFGTPETPLNRSACEAKDAFNLSSMQSFDNKQNVTSDCEGEDALSSGGEISVKQLDLAKKHA